MSKVTVQHTVPSDLSQATNNRERLEWWRWHFAGLILANAKGFTTAEIIEILDELMTDLLAEQVYGEE